MATVAFGEGRQPRFSRRSQGCFGEVGSSRSAAADSHRKTYNFIGSGLWGLRPTIRLRRTIGGPTGL